MGRWRAGHSAHIMRRCSAKCGHQGPRNLGVREESEKIKQSGDLGRDEEGWGDKEEPVSQS